MRADSIKLASSVGSKSFPSVSNSLMSSIAGKPRFDRRVFSILRRVCLLVSRSLIRVSRLREVPFSPLNSSACSVRFIKALKFGSAAIRA